MKLLKVYVWFAFNKLDSTLLELVVINTVRIAGGVIYVHNYKQGTFFLDV